jgi:predicted nucleotidyltransferase
MIAPETIQAIADWIAAEFQPERIVLFGSYARGDATEDSDVDLLIEVERDPRPNGRGNPIHKGIAQRFRVPSDVVISTSEMVRKYRDNPYSLIHHALAEGRVLYEKRPG